MDWEGFQIWIFRFLILWLLYPGGLITHSFIQPLILPLARYAVSRSLGLEGMMDWEDFEICISRFLIM